MNKKILFIALFLVILIGSVTYWFYLQSTFSKEILRLEILGSDTAKVGDEITYTIKYKNNGNTVLENPKLIFYMPDNSLTEDGKTIINQKIFKEKRINTKESRNEKKYEKNTHK